MDSASENERLWLTRSALSPFKTDHGSDNLVTLRIGKSKNKEAQDSAVNRPSVPVNRIAGKRTLLGLPLRFHFREKPIKEFRKAWKTAWVAAGLGRLEQRPDSKNQKYVDTIVHDLRRCAARNLFLVGMAQAVAMKITGHKTRSMYRHYRIIDEKDLREAAARLQAHLDERPKTKTLEQLRAAG